MTAFRPFTAPPRPFRIGLKPVDPADFLFVDGERARYLAQKRALYAASYGDVVMAEPETTAAQQEAAGLLLAAAARHADHPVAIDGSRVDIPRAGTVDLADWRQAPLAGVALCLQDDLALMRRGAAGWRLVAASIAFPSSWRLGEKFGRPLEAIHAPVPGMDGPMGARIGRIFDSLKPGIPVWRENFSFEADGRLRYDRSKRVFAQAAERKRLDGAVTIRAEYQTLHRLPVSGDILFTIRVLTRDVAELRRTSAGLAALAAIAGHVASLDAAERAYKGIDGDGTRLIATLAG
jgi:hypothetical protein